MQFMTLETASEDVLRAARKFLKSIENNLVKINGHYHIVTSKQLFTCVEKFQTLIYENGMLLTQITLDDGVIQDWLEKMRKIARRHLTILIANEMWEKESGQENPFINMEHHVMWDLLDDAVDDCIEILNHMEKKDNETLVLEMIDEAKKSDSLEEFFFDRRHSAMGIQCRENTRLSNFAFYNGETIDTTPLFVKNLNDSNRRYEVIMSAIKRLTESGEFEEKRSAFWLDWLQGDIDLSKKHIAFIESLVAN